MTTPRKHNPMTRMLKRAMRARREHGIALLFTLCILSMALITAMIFSSNASTGRKVASAYVDTSAARILADGAVSRAILALMQSENAPYVCSNYKTNPPTGNANDYASDWIWKMEKSGLFSFNNGPLRFNASTYYDREDTRCPSWEYVYCNNYGDTTNTRIFGRFAYVAIGMNDQLNPNAIGKRDYGDFDATTFGKRLGRWTCEPYFYFRSSQWNYSEKINPKAIHENFESKTNDEGWEDLDVFIDDLTGGGNTREDKQLKMMADQYFDVSSHGEYNKFRFDGNGVSDLTKHETSVGEQFRFPLIRNDWDSITVDAVKNAIPWFGEATSQANVNQTVANLINYNASWTRPAVSDNDNWVTGEPSYTGNKRTPYINEVLGDVSVHGNLGVRMTQRFLADPDNPSSWQWRVWYTDCTYDHEITLSVETVNMYPTVGNEAVLRVQAPRLIGEISYEYFNPNAGNGNGSWIPEKLQFNTGDGNWDVLTPDGTDGYQIYTYLFDSGSIGSVTTPKRDSEPNGKPYTSPMGHEADFYGNIKVRNVKVSLDRVIMYDDGGRNADLALMPTLLQSGKTFITGRDGVVVAGAGDFSRHFYFDTQVNDPRFNLARGQWSSPVFSENDINSVGATINLEDNRGYVNNKINLGSYHDNENRSDPAYAGNSSISTAYIRHGQMESLWELGAVHRGAPWQTINLKCAPAKGTRMDSYQLGDGHLLDHVALARSTEGEKDSVIGLVNLNCVANFGGGSAPFVFKSLFTEFPIYQSYANMNNGQSVDTIKGISVDSDDSGSMAADAYAKELSEAVTYAIKQGNLRRRTAVFPTAYPSSMEKIFPKNVPDAQSEEIFSRVVNLLKWDRQQIRRATVLVLAQTIRDAGGASLERNLTNLTSDDIMYDFGYQSFSDPLKKTSPTSVTASSLKSKYNNKAVSVAYRAYDNTFDQIIGEAKLIVRLEWDESANDNKGAWIITRREYAE